MGTTLADRIREAFGTEVRPADIARATNCSRGAVTQWLNGSVHSLRAETATLMELATGYRASWIVSGKGPRKVGEAGPSSSDMELLADFHAMTEDDQAELAGEIRTRAARTRAHVTRILTELGVSPQRMLTPEDAAARYKIALSRPNSGTMPGTKKRSA
jgi:transcriptional regulator with XRE-family HTH domain